jgi:PAS domain S-box-containing protein
MSKQHDPRSGAAGTAACHQPPAAAEPLPAPLPEELRGLLAAALSAINEAVSISAAGAEEPPEEPRIVFVNAAFTGLTGYSAEEAIGRPSLLAGPRTDRAMVAELLARVMSGHGVSGETLVYRKDGSEAWMELRAAPIRDLAGRVTHIVTSQREVTARRESQEAAERSSLAKSLFLSRISHELMTPLNSLIGFPELLADGHFGPLNDRQRQAIGNVLEAGEHLRRLLRDLLDLARLESGRLQLELSRFDLGALLSDLAAPVAEAARRKGLTLGVEVAGGLPLVEGDPARLKQVALNLLDNAVKYTAVGGWVKLRVWPARSAAGAPLVRLAVEDSGIGIRPEDQQRIFRTFEQVDPSLTRRQSGTGLGLALVTLLLDLHGGRAWVESPGEGQGSAFHVEVPGVCP